MIAQGIFSLKKKLKKKRHCNIIPSDLLKSPYMEQTKTIFNQMKTIPQWIRRSRHNGTTPTSQKYTEIIELETLSKFRQQQFNI